MQQEPAFHFQTLYLYGDVAPLVAIRQHPRLKAFADILWLSRRIFRCHDFGLYIAYHMIPGLPTTTTPGKSSGTFLRGNTRSWRRPPQ